MRPKRIKGPVSQPVVAPSMGEKSRGPSNLPPTKKRQAPALVSPSLGLGSHPPPEEQSFFFCTSYDGKVAIFRKLAQQWELATCGRMEGGAQYLGGSSSML